jgi:lysophospholipase L1-like esterase
MIARIFILVLTVSFSAGCSAQLSESDAEMEKEPEITKESNYLALGDSYTIGQSVPVMDRFPVILVDELNAKGYRFADPRIIARTGWTTDELMNAINDENIQDTFDLVTLLIGVNNQYRGRSLENYREEYQLLLSKALDFTGGNNKNVVVVSIPDWGVSPFGAGRDRAKIAEEIDQFNAVKKEETEKRGISFVNITEISRTALDNPVYFAEDGLHFSGEMHKLWVDAIINQCFE